jgi:hypothetical protein
MQVGGPGFSKVMELVNRNGRVALCGAIATYNLKEPVLRKYSGMDDFLFEYKVIKKYQDPFHTSNFGRIELTNFIIYCLNWIRCDQNSTYQTVPSFSCTIEARLA